MTETRWLTSHEQRLWRNWLKASSLLDQRLATELDESCHDIALTEYAILVKLTEAPDRSLRMSELAEALVHSRSRLTHAIARLEARGFVQRRSCAEDGRGVVAALTDAGDAALTAAAPTHVAGVRTHLFDQLSDDQVEQLAEILDALVTHLGPGAPCTGQDDVTPVSDCLSETA